MARQGFGDFGEGVPITVNRYEAVRAEAINTSQPRVVSLSCSLNLVQCHINV